MTRPRYKNKKCLRCEVLVRDTFCVKHFKENRIKNGLCEYCGKTNTNNKNQCEDCLIKRRNRCKAIYNPEKEHLRYLKRKRQVLDNNAKWDKNKYNSDISYRLKKNLKNRFKSFLRDVRQGKKVNFSEVLGCEDFIFTGHIESLFDEKTNWSNYGDSGWHIDHIIPLSFFDLKNELHQRLCNNYQNLQPLEASLNIKKSDKIILDKTGAHVIWLDDGVYAIMEEETLND